MPVKVWQADSHGVHPFMKFSWARAVPMPLTGTSHPYKPQQSSTGEHGARTQLQWQLVINSIRHLPMLNPIIVSSSSNMALTLAAAAANLLAQLPSIRVGAWRTVAGALPDLM